MAETEPCTPTSTDHEALADECKNQYAPLEPTAPLAEDEAEPISPANPQEQVAPPSPVPKPSFAFRSDLIYPRVAVPEPVVEPNPPTMFGRVPERCVTFCVDTSGSMFHSLDVVKEHLMETLSAMATRDDQPMFNLIEFNSQVTQWADKLVQCTPETVAVAGKWVSSLAAKTATNTQDALLAAMADPTCQSVYLVTDSVPDQFAEEVLDKIVGVCGKRRIHCIYITGETADEATTEFLEDLAVETFGSFHIVTLTNHGCVDRVTPIYRSDHAHERIVHTVNNTIRPNIKTCSVSTTLQVDPEEVLGLAPRSTALTYPPNPYLVHPALISTLPDHYYYPYYWSRYRPAKAWLKAEDKLGDPLIGLSPAAGSMLVGKKVLARRIEDGYFYRATVQSQNLGEKFLIAFGPCKHGKYRQTEYQDTHVFDIVDYHDALRHTIITGDRVLAPWEPEGERFAPGIVIEGQEKRHAEGPDDHDLTISFSNGRTEKVPRDVAVWIPSAVFERLSLELQMPKEARQTLLSTVDQYPIENLPGYPATGPLGDPPEYPKVDPFLVECSSALWDPYLYRYSPYLPAYLGYPPFVVSRKERTEKGRESTSPTTYAAEEDSTIIPGTDMTRQELDERIMSQLMEHRLAMAETSKTDVTEPKTSTLRVSSPQSRLLGRREKQDEKSLKRSVRFEEEMKTKGLEKSEGIVLDDSAYDEYGNLKTKSDCGVNTDSSLLFYRSPGIKDRPRWRYWSNDSIPSYSEISGCLGGGSGKPVSSGPFRETALQAPLEARDTREPPYNVEWPSSAFKYVDTFAKHDYSNSVVECLATPKPPATKKDVGTCSHSYTVAARPIASMTPEEREEARRALRSRRVLKREQEWQKRLAEEDNMKAIMQDQHRERIISQMERDRRRQIKEQEDILRAREGKKKISTELRARIEEHQKEEAEKEEKRIAALRRRRERREEIEAQRDKEIQQTAERRDQIRKQNNEARHDARTKQLNEEEAQTAALNKQHQNAKLRRLRHFRELERQGQEKKDLRIAVTEQHQAVFRSQIFA